MASPLDGIRVLDMATALAGPLTSQLLGDLGADVIKIEKPEGDGYRGRLYPTEDDVDEAANPRFDCANRNKRSIAVDLKTPEGLAIVEDLIRTADVLIHNYRPNVAERIGIGEERCKELNPRLVYAHLTGYGLTGPWSKRRGADIWSQGIGGTVAPQGSPGGPPILGATAFVDHGAPLALAFGITAALYERERTGVGAPVRTSLLETVLYMQSSSNLTDYLNGGELVVKGGRGWAAGFPMGAYTASDGEVITMMIGDDQWDTMLRVLGLEELRGRPEYDTQAKRVAARHELYPILDEAFKKGTREHWGREFAKTGIIRADPALRYDEVVEHPQVLATESIIPVPHPAVGSFLAIAGPVTVDGVRSEIRTGPPLVGQHTAEVLAELGRDEAMIARLFDEGVAHSKVADTGHRSREDYALHLAGADDEGSV